MNKTCIVIVGPTAVGKTSLAIDLAHTFSAPIISADSRQCYKELSIGVAKPSDEELAQAPHYFINSHSIFDEVNAAIFEKYALNKLTTFFEDSSTTIVVGGTGLYIKSFCEGIDEIPPIPKEIRDSIITKYEALGMEWLINEIKTQDEQYYSQGEITNPQRVMRALEVITSTGKSILSFQSNKKKKRDFNIIKIGLEMPRPILYERINDRVDTMIKNGLLKEVEGLYAHRNLNALQTVGYSELFDYLDGTISLDKAIEKIKQNSRHYAKRQLTWFKRDADIKWFNPNELEEVVKYIKNYCTISR
jgi:tRNA dimethylallyltransferase